MNVVSDTELRAQLSAVVDRVVADRTPVLIARREAEAVVMVSLADWNAMKESPHLVSTPANPQRIAAAVRELGCRSR